MSLGVYAKDDIDKANPLKTQIKEVVFLGGVDFDGANSSGAFSGFTSLEHLEFHGNVSIGGDATRKGGYLSGTNIKQVDFYGSGKINGAFMRHIPQNNEATITFHEGCTAQLSTRYYKDGSYYYNFPSNTLNNWTIIINPGVTFINISLKSGDSAMPVLYSKDISGLNLVVAASNPSDYEGTDLTTSHGLKYTVDSTSAITATVKTWCELGYHNYEIKECAEICSKCGNAKPLANPNHNITTVVEYKNGFAVIGSKTTACVNAGCPLNATPTVEEIAPLFTFKGYSTNDKDQICVGYIINLEAITEYEANNGEAVFNYGFVASANNNTPLDASGNKVSENVIAIDLTNEKYTAIDFKLSGNWSDSKNADAKISMNLYTVLTEGEATTVSYVYGYNSDDTIVSESYDVADQISYNDLNPVVVEPQA